MPNPGKNKKKREIMIPFDGGEILEKEVVKFGTGGHIVLPTKYLGKKIKLLISEDKDE